ncbi:MAG: type I DNA topoisomerase [Patescibacteria group bacterium]
MKCLVIVESPTKARTIGRFLGKEYEIKASMGHVMDLPKSTLGVDVENGFAPQYEVVEDKKKIIAELKKAAESAKQIILATDPDREGEAIAAHIIKVLRNEDSKKLRGKKKDNNLPISQSLNFSISRIVFHEITNEAIQEALKNPRSVDVHLVDAQTARRVLDRLVGYKLSPLLWRKVRRGLSAGRVQSVALRLIVEREREIEKFGKEQYYTIHAFLRKNTVNVIASEAKQSQNEGIASSSRSVDMNVTPRNDKDTESTEFELIEINGQKIELQRSFQLYDGEYRITKTSIEKEKDAKKIVDDLKTKEYFVSDVIQKEMRRSPAPPYTTSTLQQDAARRLGINGRRTMSLAQKLYEEGYITYHRTDSVVVALSAQNSIRSFVQKEYGNKYLPPKPRFYATKQKLAQEAHEAIRPTAVGQVLSIKYKVLSITGEQGWKLYELIWRRAVASQMNDAVLESTVVYVIASKAKQAHSNGIAASPLDKLGDPRNDKTKNDYRLKANGSVMIFDGFLKVNPLGLQDNRLPRFSAKQNLDLVNVEKEFHETPPPPRYNDASLIKTLEEKGIGRPSTYATIVSTIEVRSYIDREKGKFIPTAVGIAVNDFLVANFSDIDDIPFTASMEDDLDNIAHGKKEWKPMIKEFYVPFEKKLEEVGDAARVKIAVEETNEKCPKCGSPLVVRTGRFGKFLACSKFPECKFTKALIEETSFTCPKDGGKIVIKKTRKGRKFYGCSNYPRCDFAAWRLKDITAS